MAAGDDFNAKSAEMSPKLKSIPYPSYIDPQKDPKSAQDWFDTWKLTSDGKAFVKERGAYFLAFKDFKPENFSGLSNADGTFTFDDIPVGDYQLHVSAMAPIGNPVGVGPTKVIGRLNYEFSMPDGAENSKEPFDVGVQILEAVKGKAN